jgi:hypothetical protein
MKRLFQMRMRKKKYENIRPTISSPKLRIAIEEWFVESE